MHDCEGVYGALAAALRPGNVLGVTGGAEVPGVEVGLVAGVALAEPELVGLGLLPVEVGLGLGNGDGKVVVCHIYSPLTK